MKGELQDQLVRVQEYLLTAPKEELVADWAEVQAMKLNGPKFSELFNPESEDL